MYFKMAFAHLCDFVLNFDHEHQNEMLTNTVCIKN